MLLITTLGAEDTTSVVKGLKKEKRSWDLNHSVVSYSGFLSKWNYNLSVLKMYFHVLFPPQTLVPQA